MDSINHLGLSHGSIAQSSRAAQRKIYHRVTFFDPVIRYKAAGKRLVTLMNGYRKVAYGKMISEAVGIQSMQRQCTHFNDWLTRIEHLPRMLGDEA